MKSKRFILLGAALVLLLILYVILVVPPNLNFNVQFKNAAKALQSIPPDHIESAVQRFVQDRTITNSIVPETLSLGELVSGRYLLDEDAKAFVGVAAMFHTGTDAMFPQMILASVELPHGAVAALLRDGSVILMSRGRYSEAMQQQKLSKTNKTLQRTETSQARPEPKSPPSGPGSGR